LAFDSIAERYSAQRARSFDSDKVLAMKGDPTLPKSDAERTEKAIRSGAFEPKAS
jgi:hypothetical protein